MVSTAACLQIAATSATFVLQDLPADTWSDVHDKRPASDALVEGAPTRDGAGFLTISDAPGRGVKLKAGAWERFPYRPRKIDTRLHIDGSVVDQ